MLVENVILIPTLLLIGFILGYLCRDRLYTTSNQSTHKRTIFPTYHESSMPSDILYDALEDLSKAIHRFDMMDFSDMKVWDEKVAKSRVQMLVDNFEIALEEAENIAKRHQAMGALKRIQAMQQQIDSSKHALLNRIEYISTSETNLLELLKTFEALIIKFELTTPDDSDIARLRSMMYRVETHLRERPVSENSVQRAKDIIERARNIYSSY